MKTGPFLPAEALITWFDALPDSYRIQVSLHVVESIPTLSDVPYDDPVSHFRDWLRAPIARDLELFARIGAVKSIIGVSFVVPMASADIQAFSQADIALRIIRYKANKDDAGLERWQSIEKRKPLIESKDADFILSWLELCDDKTGVLSDRALYQWTFDEQERDSPIIPNETSD